MTKKEIKKKNYKEVFNFEGKVILITGGGGTIGKEFARAFSECGGKIAIADISPKKAKKISNEIVDCGGISIPIQVDVSKIDSIGEMVEKVIKKFGKIDILLNHAGINIRKAAKEVTEDDWTKIIDVNLKGNFFIAQKVGRQMIKQKKGKIINTASVSAVRGHPNLAIYAASKGGIVQFTKVLANEWAKFNINVNAIGAGYTLTDQTKYLLSDKKKYNTILSKIPMKRLGCPRDIANVALFLASDFSSYITGQTIFVEGGRLID